MSECVESTEVRELSGVMAALLTGDRVCGDEASQHSGVQPGAAQEQGGDE